MLRKIVSDAAHCFDRLRIDLTRWPRAGAVRFYSIASMNARKRFRHLAAVRILDADKEEAFRGQSVKRRIHHTHSFQAMRDRIVPKQCYSDVNYATAGSELTQI